jgi:hypothetical protein
VQVGATPVIIAQRIEWVAPEALRAEREAFTRQLKAWLADWQSLDADRYLEHYAREFRSEGVDLVAWGAHKRRVNAAKSWIKVSLANVSVFRSPQSEGPIVVAFDQDYRSSNFVHKSRKRQYWVEEGGRWKIAFEGPDRQLPVSLPASYQENFR